MSKTWRIIEIVISLCILGLSFLSFRNFIDIINSQWVFLELGNYGDGFGGFLKFLVMELQLTLLLSILSLLAGILLLLQKKIGWILSVALFGALTIIWVYLLIDYLRDPIEDPRLMLFFSTLLGFFLVCLLQKPFIRKYSPTKKSWVVISTIVIFLVLDSLFLTL